MSSGAEPCSVVLAHDCEAAPDSGVGTVVRCYRCGEPVCRRCSMLVAAKIRRGERPGVWRTIRVCQPCVESGTEKIRPRERAGVCTKSPRPFVHLFVRHINLRTRERDAYFSCRLCGIVRARLPSERRGCRGVVAVGLRPAAPSLSTS